MSCNYHPSLAAARNPILLVPLFHFCLLHFITLTTGRHGGDERQTACFDHDVYTLLCLIAAIQLTARLITI